MRYRKILACLCALSLAGATLFTGCGTEKNALMDMRVGSDNGKKDSMLQAGDSDYVSRELCVIPKKSQSKPKDSVMRAKASLMINESDRKMLYSDNIYKKIYPASITKIVTAYVALKYGKLDDVVTVSYNASHITESGATLCGFMEGDRIVMRNLLNVFLVHSGNDAGIAIAEHIAGDEAAFADLMNQEMAAVGAVHSHFVNSHGLHDNEHYTTAYDLYLIFRRLIQNETFMQIVSQGSYKTKYQGKDGKKKKMSFLSTDRYLTGRAVAPKGVKVVGGKTGTTYNAGSCLILYSIGPDKKKYISVVAKADGGDDLYWQMNHLLAMETE